MQNLSNIRPDDITRITGIDRKWAGMLLDNNIQLEMYIIKFTYNDGTTKFIRVFCEPGTSQIFSDDKKKNEFFINRLFGNDGLIVKEGRNDYIYLGCVYDDGRRITRFKKSNSGKTMQEEFDDYFKKVVMPMLICKGNPSDFDPIDMEYHFHTGREDMNDVFQNGLLNNYASSYGPHFTSTFYPADGKLTIINNLEDAVRVYGKDTKGKGEKVFITRIPKKYRGLKNNATGTFFPPMPTAKMLDVSKNLSIVIPEIIYGMYDMETGILHKNPNYCSKFNPNGLTYDDETIRKIYDSGLTPDLVEFMKMRKDYNYYQLKKHDEKYGIFEQYCQYYGITLYPSYENSDSKRRI